MSVDIRIGQECSHLILEDWVTLGADRRSMPTASPVASIRSVRVFANDVPIPSAGLYAQAEITGDVAGPFVVPVCDRSLTVTTSTHSTTVPLLSDQTGMVGVVQLAQALSGALPQAAVIVEAGRLVIADYGSVGASSRVVVSGPGARHVGFSTQRGAVGGLVYPGWQVEDGRYPVFRVPIPGNPVLKVSYVASPTQCRRCASTRVENDWQFSLQGDVLMVENEDLLVQAALKILLTQLRSNYYHPAYGTTLMGRIGSKAVGPVASQIGVDVRQALATMAAQQGQQSKFQAVTARERLYTVRTVNVYADPNDPTVFQVDVEVSNASNQPVSVSVVYTAPGAVALAGTNGLSLGN